MGNPETLTQYVYVLCICIIDSERQVGPCFVVVETNETSQYFKAIIYCVWAEWLFH